MKFIFLLGFLLTLSACQEAVLHDLPELDANRVIAKLFTHQIKGEKARQADGNWTIKVAGDQLYQTIAVLEDQQLVKINKGKLKKKSFLSGSNVDHEIRVSVLADELRESISSLPAVIEAHVHLNIPEEKKLLSFAQKQDSATAAVVIATKDQSAVSASQVKSVVNGATGIDRELIEVVLNEKREYQNEILAPGRNQPSETLPSAAMVPSEEPRPRSTLVAPVKSPATAVKSADTELSKPSYLNKSVIVGTLGYLCLIGATLLLVKNLLRSDRTNKLPSIQ